MAGGPSPSKSTTAAAGRPRWQLPDKNRERIQAVCLESERFWVLAAPADLRARAARQAERSWDATLYCFERSQTRRSVLPLRFQLPEDPSGQGRWGGLPGGRPLLEATPDGLTAALPGVQGFWIISRKELLERGVLQQHAARQTPATQ